MVGEVEVEERPVGGGNVETDRPTSGAPCLFERGRDTAGERDGEMFDGAGGGFGDDGRNACAAMTWEYQAGGAGGFGRAGDGTEVSGIADTVERDDEGVGRVEEVVEVGGVEWRRGGDDALGYVASGQRVDAFWWNHVERGAGEGSNFVEGRVVAYRR